MSGHSLIIMWYYCPKFDFK